MDAVVFLNSFNLALDAIRQFNLSEEKQIELAMQLAVKVQELNNISSEMALKEQIAIQEMEIKALDAKHKYENSNIELLKSIIQSFVMLESMRDNANINKSNSMVSLFHTVINAQNISNLNTWKSFFTKLEKTIGEIGQEGHGDNSRASENLKLLMALNTSQQNLSSLNQALQGFRGAMIVCPRYEIRPGDLLIIKGVSISSLNNYFLSAGKRVEGNILNFSQQQEGDYVVHFFSGSSPVSSASVTIKVRDIRPEWA